VKTLFHTGTCQYKEKDSKKWAATFHPDTPKIYWYMWKVDGSVPSQHLLEQLEELINVGNTVPSRHQPVQSEGLIKIGSFVPSQQPEVQRVELIKAVNSVPSGGKILCFLIP
jgi:hypothetical protein